MHLTFRGYWFLIILLAGWNISKAQTKKQENIGPYIVVPAGVEYEMSPLSQKLWGKLYRREWITPVKFPVALLDTLKGGVQPTKAGGGNQTKSLTVETKEGKKYTLRTVNKTLGKVLPEEFLGTFIEDLVNDKVSMSHPYSAAATAYLAEKAKIYHTNPTFVYLPKQPALDTFENFGNEVYLFEQKIDGDWKEADNLGNFENFINTFKLIDSLHSDNRFQVDQKLYVRSRLFDMLINDWDRHEDQWEWGAKDVNGQTVFSVVPQDRDQAFFSYDGVMLNILFPVSGMKYFQPFDEEIKDVKQFNYEQRNLDRYFANELSLSDWQQIARELQAALTNDVIETSLKQMPPEVHELSGDVIAAKLKGRRDRLEEYATNYYKFIAKEVDITGSKKPEFFEIKRLNPNETQVNIYYLKSGIKEGDPFYSRKFIGKETEEIRLYGMSGHDQYHVEGKANDTRIRLIGGDSRDSMTLAGGKVHVYDNKDNYYTPGSKARYHLSNKENIHEYKYATYIYDKQGIKPTLFYNNPDRLFVGVGFGKERHKWRKEPFAYKYEIGLNYSISQKAASANYNGLYPNAVGKWDLAIEGIWDAVRWTNFFGLGNESKFIGDNIDYYRARTEEWIGSAGLVRKIGHSNISISAIYQRVRVKNDVDRYTGKVLLGTTPDLFKVRRFAGAEVVYNLHHLNDSIVPTKGFVFTGTAGFLQNVKSKNRGVGNVLGDLRVYVPLISNFSLALIVGGEAVTGKPEFYQYASVGGGRNVRGFRRTRYWGETAFYNSNEIRYITSVKSKLYNGKLGLVSFYDIGRVWLKKETSNTMHHGYGAGILFAPFNKFSADLTYGISKDETLIQLRLTKPIR